MSKKKIPKEIMEKVIYLNCKKDEDNIRRLDKSLMKLPFIKDESDLETDRLEEIIKKIESKHNIYLAYLMKYKIDGLTTYSAMIKTADTASKHLITINAVTIRETLGKAIFYMYYYLQNHKGD